MRVWLTVALVALLGAAFAGCLDSGRDIESEAKDRERWAKDHNRYDPVASLHGPKAIAPGAVVWFSAYGSHDPDFFGATQDQLRDEARREGGVHYENEYDHGDYHWYVSMDANRDEGLGVGIREYRWQIDDGAVLVAPELTHRYGSLDGPIRLPVGFTHVGSHTIRLTVVDWSGNTDTVSATIDVRPDGTHSQLPGWTVTDEGFVYTQNVDVPWTQYGACQPLRDSYDQNQHHVSVPWDIVFYMERVRVTATWDEVSDPVLGVASGNLNDIDMTLGHCETDHGAWKVFDADTEPFGDNRVEGGEVAGEEFAGNLEITGHKTERRGEWDMNVYLSDKGNGQWGSGIETQVRYNFVLASETGYGGL